MERRKLLPLLAGDAEGMAAALGVAEGTTEVGSPSPQSPSGSAVPVGSAEPPVAVGIADAVGAAEAAEIPPVVEVLPLTPGFWVRSTSCVPSAIGPEGLARQDPAGDRGADMPKGIVPFPPTAIPPTKVLGSSPWNWHWKRPLSSALRGAD